MYKRLGTEKRKFGFNIVRFSLSTKVLYVHSFHFFTRFTSMLFLHSRPKKKRKNLFYIFAKPRESIFFIDSTSSFSLCCQVITNFEEFIAHTTQVKILLLLLYNNGLLGKKIFNLKLGVWSKTVLNDSFHTLSPTLNTL